MSFDFFVRQRLLPAGRLPACVLFVRVFAFRPNRFLPASTRFFRSFPSGPAASVRFPSSGLFSSAPFVRVSSSTGSVLLFHYRKITDFSLCGRHACSSRPACSLSVSVRSVLPFLSVPLRAVSPPRCPCIDFSRRRFLSRYREISPTPSLCGRHTRPCCPSCSRSVSVRSVSPFLSVPLPSRFPFPPSLCELFVFGGDLPTLPERNPPCPSSCPDRFRPIWLFGSAVPFCSPSFVLPPAFRCPLVLLLPSASTLLSPGLSVFSP